ncbi:MAG TPA: hypothetical protein DEQ02_06875, partial [Ruminococcaceae bacterium]|nr:hypothetical protein [Oscillospiraceae bacterium]
MFTKLTRDLHKNTISISACVLVLALICGVFGIASMQTDSTLAEKPQPGTRAYYDARWEEAKVKAGNKLAGTPYTSHDGVSMTTAAEGPWRLDLREDYLAGKISAPWDGVAAGTAMTVADTVTGAAYNATTNPYKVTTAEQFRWCIVNRRSFILQNDIDLGGYLGRNWTTTTATSAVWSAEGGGHTVYNFYMNAPTGGNAALFSSMTGNSYATQVNNMRISHSYIKDSSAGQTAFFAVTAGPRTMNNCAVENSMASTPAGADDRYLTGFVRNGFTITDSYTRNVHLYNRGLDNGNGTAHVAGFLMPSGYEGMATVVTDCFAVDGTVISNGGHSGGFVSCSNPLSAATITNCFTGMEIYGNKQVGAFLGIIGHGTIRMNNCFATGILEGKLELGGFGSKATSNAADGVTAAKRFNSCYTTASVGMESGGTDIGGFASEVGLGSDYYTDCYAAGEVGSIDTNVSPDRQNDSKNVGGFLGTYNNSTTSYRFTNCFYDKQTTGMKQWATGSTASSGANWGGYTSDWLQAQTVANKDLKGVLTTDTDKSGTGLTSAPNSNTASDGLTNASFTGFSDNDKWVFEKDHYPQLKVFALPTTFTNTNWMSQTELSDLVKAYSRASTATAKLETWDKGFTYDGSAPAPVLGKEVYDTVRDLTRKFYNTTTQGDLPSIDHSVNHALFTAVPTALNGSDIPYGIDGVATSSWASSGNNTLPWYQVDLGTEMPVKKINITWPTTANRALNYRLQTSNDGVAFTDVLTVTGATTGINLHELPATVNARYVRMQTDQKAGAATSAIRIHEFLVDGMVTARASGISGAANYPANALKDDATFWRAANVPNPWLIVDMGGVKPVDRIEIDWPPASTSDNNRATSYEIKLSNNDMSDADWLALPADHIYTGNAGGTNYISLPGKTARYIQIYATAKGASAATIQISGFRVYGDNGATSALSTSWAKGSLVDPNYRDDQALFTAVPTASGGSNIPYAVDGNETTTTSYWQADNVVNAWYQLDLRKRMPLSKMRIVWPSTTTNRATDYEIRVSSDNVSWNTVYTYSAANGGALNPGGVNEITLPPGTTGRYVRMYALSRVGTAAIRIFEFWVDGMVTATASTTNALANSPVVALQENATEWISTNVTAAPFPWYQVDLGSVKPVERVEINWPTTTNRAATYYIQTSTDGINFTNAPVVGSASGGLVTGTTGLNVHDFPAVNAKYIRMQTQTKAASGATIRISNFRVFSPYAATSNDGSELIPATVDLWGETGLEVLYLGQDSGGYFCKDFVPGIEWLHVYADVGGQVASRRMRIIPTAALDPGSGRLISKGSTYDHADEVRMAYSTGPRMNSDMEDVTVGVYPDGPTLADFTEYQEKNQAFPDGNVGTADLADSPKLPLFLGDDNKYIGAYASHMSKTAGDNADTGKLYLKVFRDATVDINNNLVAYSSQIGLDNAGGSSALSAGNNNRFNGIAPFTDTTKTNYLLDYYWELADGRYLQNGKLIYYKELPFNAEINVKTGTETGEQNDEALSLSIGAAANPAFSDTVGHKELEVGSGQQAKISWKFSQGYGPHDITKIILQMTENDDGDMGDPVVINSPRLDGTDTFTVRRTYRRNISLDGVDYLADAIVVDKTYKIMVGTDGGGGTYYYLAFDKAEIVEGLDGRNVMLNDVEDDIIVTIVFADVVHKKNAYLNYSGTAQNGDDENYVKTRNGDYITYEILVDNPPPSGRLEGFKPKLPQPGKINFINGSFEQPVVATTPMFPEDNPWSNAGIETGSYIGCAYYRYSMVDGWYTVPTNPADIGRAHWNCIQYFTGANISWMTYPYPNGYQAAELNAHYPSRLYQIVETVPGTKVYWELYHEAAQGLNGTPHGGGTQSSEESLNVYIYGTPAPGEAGDSSTNRANPPAGTLQATCTTKVSERWKKYTGSYTVPAEQTSTLLAFEAAASYTGSPAHGQYLDGIRIYTNSYIDLIKSNNSDGTVTNGEIVEYEIKAKNLGESDASNVVISDVLPEGT